VTGIDPFHPLRPAIDEARRAAQAVQDRAQRELKDHNCKRAILVGHNSFFDLQFFNAAVERTGIKRNPFHPFSSFDTATLAGVAFGQTVLGRAVAAAGFTWDEESQAHSALYDAEMTARVFCMIVNRFRGLLPRSLVRRHEPATAPVPARRFPELARLYSSSAMSQPPISSPLTYSCGNVGQFEYCLQPFADLGILEDVDVGELRADARSAATVWAENPHCGKSGVPFI
jgi:DNA polymerase III epsilon subunit-like protein